MKRIFTSEKFKAQLEEVFKQKNIYLIDWTPVLSVNSSIFLIGDVSQGEDFIPEQLGIEVSTIKPMYVLYMVKERRKKMNHYKQISFYGYSTPDITEIDDTKLVQEIASIIKLIPPTYVQVELNFALENLYLFSDINLKYF